MNKMYLHNFRWVVAFLLVFVVGTTSGCETLRKKFTRRKKNQVIENQQVAILDPIDYPDKVKSSDQAYQEHYALLKVWMSDLTLIVEDNANEKKVLYTLSQMKEQLMAMRAFLKETVQNQMDVYLKEVDDLSLEFKKSEAFRSKPAVVSRIRTLSRNVRNDFAPQKVSESLVAL